MNLKNKLLMVCGLGMGLLAFPVNAMAVVAPHFTLTPATGNQTIGQNFDVVMGIDSGIEKVVGLDIKATFDSTKLEVVSIQKETIPSGGYDFTYVDNPSLLNNTAGTFEATLPSVNMSTLVGTTAKHGLLKITFKPKAAGVATVNYICLANNTKETNIMAQSGLDVVDCAANQSGSYTIAIGAGGAATTTPATTATPATTSGGTTSTQLPQTGGIENTLLLLVFGISSIGAALYLKLI